MEMTGGQALAAQLVREGVTTLFGLPGVQLNAAFDGLYEQRERLRLVSTRHEQGTTYMADGYARSRGEVGVAMVVPGPGVLNAGAGLATAYGCSSPVLLIAGQVPSAYIGRGLGQLHEIADQSGVLSGLTKWTAMARQPQEIPELVQAAFRQLRSGRPRPVALEVPPDILAARAEVRLLDPVPKTGLRTAPDPAVLRDAAALLKGAQHPVIVAGGGVLASGAWAELAALAERLQAPVVVTRNGWGALDSRHPLCLNSMGGSRVLPDADVVLAAGTRYVGAEAMAAERARVVLLNADPHDLGDPRHPALAMEADARLGFVALAGELEGLPRRPGPWCDLDAVRAACAELIQAVQPQARFLQALRTAIPDDGFLVSELTQVGYMTEIGYPIHQPGTLLKPGYQGTLGYGFPTAIGVKAGSPDRAVVSITGDGGFGWALPELATAKRFHIASVTVVFDDKAFGNVKRQQKEGYDGHVYGSELTNPDYVRLAEAFGIRGMRADSPEALEGALKEALADGGPVLISVPVGEMPNPWPLLGVRPLAMARR